ncbi:MAG: hypothetical protein P8X68_06460 [Desulfobacterales bacterium]
MLDLCGGHLALPSVVSKISSGYRICLIGLIQGVRKSLCRDGTRLTAHGVRLKLQGTPRVMAHAARKKFIFDDVFVISLAPYAVRRAPFI